MLRNEKILITGPSSQVAFPIARALAGENTVYGLARLSAAADRERLEAVGVRCIQSDLDLTRMHEYLGRTKVPWRDGIRRMLHARHPRRCPAA